MSGKETKPAIKQVFQKFTHILFFSYGKGSELFFITLNFYCVNKKYTNLNTYLHKLPIIYIYRKIHAAQVVIKWKSGRLKKKNYPHNKSVNACLTMPRSIIFVLVKYLFQRIRHILNQTNKFFLSIMIVMHFDMLYRCSCLNSSEREFDNSY